METRFDRIVKEVETLMRKFENGEKKECFMELYSTSINLFYLNLIPV